MKFPYRKFSLDEHSEFFGKAILKPIIPIELIFGDKNIRYMALIDSGADFCILHDSLAKELGLSVQGGREIKFGGIQNGKPSKAFLHSLKINVGGRDYETTLGFSSEIAPHGYGILGQKGFFDIFTVQFDLAKEEIELKE